MTEHIYYHIVIDEILLLKGGHLYQYMIHNGEEYRRIYRWGWSGEGKHIVYIGEV